MRTLNRIYSGAEIGAERRPSEITGIKRKMDFMLKSPSLIKFQVVSSS